MEEISFRIRPYFKRELAELYFPETVNTDPQWQTFATSSAGIRN